MSYRREPCRNFQRGSCHYGDRCKFLHVSQQQSRPNPFGFGNQNNSQPTNMNQQQKPNPFGFGVQNTSGTKGAQNFGGRNETSTKPFGNTWNRQSSAATANASQQANTQAQSATHKCTDPETCKRQMVEDFKNELPLWRLTCYGHWKNLPCDIVGDVSYEELRAAAYGDARRGVPLQAIIERERNMYNSKSAEFDNLLRNPYVIPRATTSQTNPFPGANTTISSFGSQNNAPGANTTISSFGSQNNAPGANTTISAFGSQNNAPGANTTISAFGSPNNAPPSFSSFSQLGASANLGSNVRAPAPANTPNSIFGQPNLPQYNSQGFSGIGMNFGSSGQLGGQLPTQPSASSPGLFGSQMSPQPFGNAPGPNAMNFQNSSGGFGGVSSSLVPPQFPSSTSNKPPSFPGGSRDSSDLFPQASTLDKEEQEDSPDDSIWLKNQWAIGEIPTVAPPERFCT